MHRARASLLHGFAAIVSPVSEEVISVLQCTAGQRGIAREPQLPARPPLLPRCPQPGPSSQGAIPKVSGLADKGDMFHSARARLTLRRPSRSVGRAWGINQDFGPCSFRCRRDAACASRLCQFGRNAYLRNHGSDDGIIALQFHRSRLRYYSSADASFTGKKAQSVTTVQPPL